MSTYRYDFSGQDTIAAVATPPGEGGIAVIRISGPQAFGIADRIFSGSVLSYPSHTVHYGKIRTLLGEPVDDVLLIIFRAPRSFTGEDTIEIHCHGGSLVTRRVLETALSAGARAAKPGEFSFRSFLNGKMDLSQAEAVQALIGARNDSALAAAGHQLHGSLSKRVGGFQNELTRLSAVLEAWVDFPEEGLAFMPMEQFQKELSEICGQMERLSSTFADGRILQEGLQLCLIGAPNVGKSSLMNALLRKERAIVSPIAGTTRDIIEEELRFNGLHFRLVDTAGIREAFEQIEQEGIRRTKGAMESADIILLVMDATRPPNPDEQELLSAIPPGKTVVVWNKMDLPEASPISLKAPHVATLSAKEERGIEDLKEQIHAIIWKQGAPAKEEIVLTQLRHKESLDQALFAAQAVLAGFEKGVSPEFLTIDLRKALEHLGQIIGTDVTNDVLSSIFSQFCIGK